MKVVLIKFSTTPPRNLRNITFTHFADLIRTRFDRISSPSFCHVIKASGFDDRIRHRKSMGFPALNFLTLIFLKVGGLPAKEEKQHDIFVFGHIGFSS